MGIMSKGATKRLQRGLTTLIVLAISLAICVVLVSENSLEQIFRKQEAHGLNDRILQADDDADLAVTVSFDEMFRLILFLACAWFASNFFEWIGLPGLVGEIATGFLLGPPLADFCPYPEAMVLLGSYGLIGLILESGVNLDVGQLKETGLRAAMLALTGTCLALGSGLALGNYSSPEDFAAAMAVGASFAPSSLGVAAKILANGNVLNTPIGQMIVASSVVDDVLGLILLSILQVFVKDSPTTFDFILPFISSFGYLIALGYVGIAWIPYIMEHRILPLIPPQKRDLVVFCAMFALLLIYIPLLNYSGASYLTGAFLAGLSVSQIPSVQDMYDRNGREIMVWLMRIFFAATIGFQVPIKRFSSLFVLRWGVKFMIPVIAKLPLAFMVPRFRRELPEDFPYDPYWRDVLVVSLSMVCRGEFNFLVAAFGLSEGLIDADLYSAIVLAILCSSLVAPLALARVIKHYNTLSEKYMSADHPVQQIGNTCDGYRPLFLAIQARTPIHWGLQETFKRVLEEAGLLLIDHRSFHTSGQHPIDITEIFAQDTVAKVRVKGCFGCKGGDKKQILHGNLMDDRSPTASADSSEDNEEGRNDDIVENVNIENGLSEPEHIEKRLQEIRAVLVNCLLSDDPSDYVVQVSQWETYAFAESEKTTNGAYCLQRPKEPEAEEEVTPRRSRSKSRRFSSASMAQIISEIFHEPASHNTQYDVPHLSECDLWERDAVCQEGIRNGHVRRPTVGGHPVYIDPSTEPHPLHVPTDDLHEEDHEQHAHLRSPSAVFAGHLNGYVRHD